MTEPHNTMLLLHGLALGVVALRADMTVAEIRTRAGIMTEEEADQVSLAISLARLQQTNPGKYEVPPCLEL